MGYKYSNLSGEMTLAAYVSPGAATLTLQSTAGLPATYPYTLILDYDTNAVEIVTVTGSSAGSLNITRGEDGTAAQEHVAGAKVIHGLVARDFTAPQQHIEATAGVHGVTGNVVGTSDAQTLTNKTISGGSNTLSNIPESAISELSASKLTGNFNGGSAFVSAADAVVPLVAKGTATATGNLFELYKGATRPLYVDSAGVLRPSKITASQASGSAVLQAQVTGDTNPRLEVTTDGAINLGPGNAATDITVARTGASVLGLTGADIDMNGRKVTDLGAPTAGTDAATKAYVDRRAFICTSTTRPANPTPGDTIIETDTNIMRMWIGAKWLMLTPYQASFTVSVAQPTVDFPGIPATLKTLRVRAKTRTDQAVSWNDWFWRVNDITLANYRFAHIFENGGGAPTTTRNLNANYGRAGGHPGATAGNANLFGTSDLLFQNWDNTNGWLSCQTTGGFVDSTTDVVANGVAYTSVAGPYTKLTFGCLANNFVVGSTFTIQGWE